MECYFFLETVTGICEMMALRRGVFLAEQEFKGGTVPGFLLNLTTLLLMSKRYLSRFIKKWSIKLKRNWYKAYLRQFGIK